MENREIAGLFEEIADLLEVQGEKPYRIQSYRRAARSLEETAVPADALRREGRLEEIPNVGPSLAAKIEEALDTGHIAALERLRAEIPHEAHDLMAIPGVGPRTAGRLVRDLGVRTVADLEAAARSGRLASLPGMGEKTTENLLAAIERLNSRPDRIPLVDALEIVSHIEAALARGGAVQRLTAVGSIRRQEPTIGDIDLVAVSADPDSAMDAFVRLPDAAEVLAHGPSKSVIVLKNGRQVDLRIVAPDSFGSMLQHFTGSREHNIQLREHALRRGISINDYGLEDMATGRRTPCATEEEVYARLEMETPPPEIRQGSGEIEAALAGRLPHLIDLSDLKGDLHAHTTYSDGASSVREMALAARDLGYEYLAITDHSLSRAHAGGLSADRLREQAEEIRRVNAEIDGITLLRGAEVDILADGSLDYPDEVLFDLDIVVASIHSSLRQERARITERLVRAARHPAVSAIGHPTGRLLGSREPSNVDLETLFYACAAAGTALEISGVPLRLDLDGLLARRAREIGVPLALDTDSHRAAHLAGWRTFAVGQARRAWARPEDAVNAWPLARLRSWIVRKRAGAARAAT